MVLECVGLWYATRMSKRKPRRKGKELKWYHVRAGLLARLITRKVSRDFKSVNWKDVGTFCAIVYVVSLFVPFIGPYTQFPVYIVICGGMPVATSTIAGRVYYPPGSPVYKVTPFNGPYFCDEQSAKSAGYPSHQY